MVAISCPDCQSIKVKKNGHTHNGKQNHQCNNCGREFVMNPNKSSISEDKKTMIRLLLLERISLRGICRVVKISIAWLMQFIVTVYKQLPEHLNTNLQVVEYKGDVIVNLLDVESDELWSFVGNKENKQWIWLAMDSHTRQIIAFYVGDRSSQSAQELWKLIPDSYKKHATFYTDDWEAYKTVIPSAQHKIAPGTTSHLERFNCTLRQRVSRLVRLALSFSKKLENHISAIRYFICYYNKALLV